jgi:anti-anti-sigma factor
MHQPVIVERFHRMDTDRALETAMSRFPMPAADGQFAAEVQVRDDATIVTLTGEVDLATRASFASAVCGLLGPGARVTVDLGGLTLLDGGGVAVALRLQQRARALGSHLTFVHPHGIVARVLEILDPDCTLAGTEPT